MDKINVSNIVVVSHFKWFYCLYFWHEYIW